MSIRCKNCGKKHGRQLTSCPHCTQLQNIMVKFEGNYAVGAEKFLQEMLDDVRRRLPDEDAFKTTGTIFFSSPEEILKRRENSSHLLPYTEKMKELDEKLKLTAKQCGTDLVCTAKNLFESDFPDGVSVPDVNSEFFKNKSLRHIGFTIDIVVDERMLFRRDEYVKGVIVHEIIEFSTKFNVWKEHLDEIKEQADVNKLVRKYLKSGYFPPSKEYDEHEEIVNNEANRLGFEKEISIMEKGELDTANIRSNSEVAEIVDWMKKSKK